MKAVNFVPKKLENVEYIDNFSSLLNEKTRLDLETNIELFKETIEKGLRKDIGFSQIDWMGRGCYKKLDGNNGYLLGKGTGPGLGSEVMRRFLDKLQLSWAKEEGKYGGCIRVDLGEQWPFLVQYKIDSDSNIEIIDPRPEGFSIFGATYREALAGDIYNKLGVEIVKPITLYRNNSETSWEGKQDGFREKLAEKVVEELTLWNSNIKSCVVTKDDYHNLDSGILFRHAKTPYRISNLLDLCINNDKNTLKDVVGNLINDTFGEERNENSIKKLQEQVTDTLAKNAAIMFKKGIIHGQFKVHYQNISILGELSDFDSTIFLGLLDNNKENNIYKNFESTLKEGEKKYGLDMLNYLNYDLNLFAGVDNKGNVDENILYSNILGQIYDLFNQSMRINDIFKRSISDDINSGYTVLSELEYNNLRDRFIGVFKENIGEEKLSFLDNKVLNFLDLYKEKYLLRFMGDVSIYAWKNRKEINYLENIFTHKDLEYTFNDAEKLFKDILI